MAADSSGELLFSLLNHAAPQLTRQDLAPLNDSPAVLNALLLLVRTHPAQEGDRERWVAEQKVREELPCSPVELCNPTRAHPPPHPTGRLTSHLALTPHFASQPTVQSLSSFRVGSVFPQTPAPSAAQPRRGGTRWSSRALWCLGRSLEGGATTQGSRGAGTEAVQ